ncbi:MAG: hypothetical protein HY579_02810 [Nitrospinae bacterium]|nr:hypothetical protein [Nitrospinota bacterium]
MEKGIILDKTRYVHLKVNGEKCNRLPRGTLVFPVERKGEWIKVVWRNGKKKGWIHLADDERWIS